MAALQRQRAQARVGEEAQAIKAGAFGGDRRSVYEGERQGAFEAQMGQTLGQMQAQGYSQAVQRAAAKMHSVCKPPAYYLVKACKDCRPSKLSWLLRWAQEQLSSNSHSKNWMQLTSNT